MLANRVLTNSLIFYLRFMMQWAGSFFIISICAFVKLHLYLKNTRLRREWYNFVRIFIIMHFNGFNYHQIFVRIFLVNYRSIMTLRVDYWRGFTWLGHNFHIYTVFFLKVQYGVLAQKALSVKTLHYIYQFITTCTLHSKHNCAWT